MAELIKIIKQIIDSRPRDEQSIILPIHTVNDLPVTAKISIVPNSVNYLFFIDIDVNGVDVEDPIDILPLQLLSKLFYEIPIINSVIDNEYFIDSFKKIVNSLRYDNRTGKIDEDEENTQFFRDLISNENITFQEEESCSVCMEITKTKTQCNHSLCLICWSKIKSVEGDKPCPICREPLYFNKP
jgi:hypothetical protein